VAIMYPCNTLDAYSVHTKPQQVEWHVRTVGHRMRCAHKSMERPASCGIPFKMNQHSMFASTLVPRGSKIPAPPHPPPCNLESPPLPLPSWALWKVNTLDSTKVVKKHLREEPHLLHGRLPQCH